MSGKKASIETVREMLAATDGQDGQADQERVASRLVTIIITDPVSGESSFSSFRAEAVELQCYLADAEVRLQAERVSRIKVGDEARNVP